MSHEEDSGSGIPEDLKGNDEEAANKSACPIVNEWRRGWMREWPGCSLAVIPKWSMKNTITLKRFGEEREEGMGRVLHHSGWINCLGAEDKCGNAVMHPYVWCNIQWKVTMSACSGSTFFYCIPKFHNIATVKYQNGILKTHLTTCLILQLLQSWLFVQLRNVLLSNYESF